MKLPRISFLVRKEEINNSEFPPSDLNYDIFDNEKANFIHDSCKTYLKNTVENSKNLQNKALLLLSFIFSVFALSIIQGIPFFPDLEALKNWYVIKWAIVIEFAIYCVTALILTFFVLYPREKAAPGSEPKNLIRNDFSAQKLPTMKIGEAIRYQEKIDINLHANYKMQKKIKLSTATLAFTTTVFIVLVTFLVV